MSLQVTSEKCLRKTELWLFCFVKIESLLFFVSLYRTALRGSEEKRKKNKRTRDLKNISPSSYGQSLSDLGGHLFKVVL